MSKKARLKTAFNHLKNSGLAHTQKDVSERMGSPTSNVSSAFNGVEKFLTTNFLRRFNSAYNNIFNEHWLLTGEGTMLLSSKSTTLAEQEHCSYETEAPLPEDGTKIKFYPNVKGTLGGVEFLENPNESFTFIALPNVSRSDIAIMSAGESMEPKIKDGSIIIISEWLENFFDWGHIYLIVTKSGYRTIKYVYPSPNAEEIICRAENTDRFPDFAIAKDDIHKAFLVKQWIVRAGM